MGNNQCAPVKSNGLAKVTQQYKFLHQVKKFIRENRTITSTQIRDQHIEVKSVIEARSNINSYLNSKSAVELSGDIMSIFSNEQIAGVNNGNMYVTLLTPYIYEQIGEERTSKVTYNQNSWPINFMANNVDKIHNILNLNNNKDVLAHEKLNKFTSLHPINQLGKDALTSNIEKANLNSTSNSHYFDLWSEGINNPNISRQQTKYSRLNTCNTKKSVDFANCDEEAALSQRYTYSRKRKSSKSIKPVNAQSESPLNNNYKKNKLNQIQEFELDFGENEGNEEVEKYSLKHPINHKSNSNKDKIINSEIKTVNMKNLNNNIKKRKIDSEPKKNTYSVALRKRLFTGNRKKRDRRLSRSNDRSPSDLFNSKILEGFKNEDKIKENRKKNNNQNTWIINLKNNHNKGKGNNKKSELHFSINLKVFIQQEVKEKIRAPPINIKKGNGKKRERVVTSNSEDFRDSIERYLNFESSLNYKNVSKKNKSIIGSNKTDKKTKTKFASENKSNIQSVEMMSRISISNYDDKYYNNNTMIEIIPQDNETILHNIQI